MEEKRPDPELLLKKLEAAEEKKETGRLRIFFGYAAGVGKTYNMLRSARKRQREGVDVVIGYLEPHARPETTAMSEGLEQIPVKTLQYNGITLKEMDIDAILERKPELVLVDEYAHTNAEGSRHEKRYQDVEELLAAGIDVYTTVNVQHIESLCDIVASITGIFVRERIPDYAFDRADEVKLVDVEPRLLMNRLSEGKVYSTGQARRALNHFFSVEKLTALREIALRRTADRVNLLTEQTKKDAGGQYYTEEKILVGISPSPSNPKIIRTAARMAQAFGGRMIGLYVETPDSAKLSSENKKRLKDNLQLAERLGAKIETVLGEDIPFLIAEYAKTAGISKIVAGRSEPQRGLFRKATFVDKLTMYAPNMDIYIIPGNQHRHVRAKLNFSMKAEIKGLDLAKSGICLLAATAIGLLFYQMGLRETNIVTVYLLSVMAAAMLTQSRILAFVQSLFSVLVFNYCFTEPRLSLQTYDSSYMVTFFIFFAAALIIGNLILKMKVQSRELVKSAYRTRTLLEITQILQQQTEQETIGPTMAEELRKLIGRSVVYYDSHNGELGLPVFFAENHDIVSEDKDVMTTENEKAAARWVYKNRKCAGAATETLHNAACYYLPVQSLDNIYGVVGIRISNNDSLSAFEQNLVTAIICEAANAIEREVLRREGESG